MYTTVVYITLIQAYSDVVYARHTAVVRHIALRNSLV